jgi:17beta-estradiol 17-dehydrogenase / very-long-chain 3-oxoacyl-CoA reductase
VLVNNAGVAKPAVAYLHEAEVEAWVRMIRVNLWALTEVTAAVLPGMVERGRGAVVNMGSASSEAIPSFPLNTIYAATKRYAYHVWIPARLHISVLNCPCYTKGSDWV